MLGSFDSLSDLSENLKKLGTASDDLEKIRIALERMVEILEQYINNGD